MKILNKYKFLAMMMIIFTAVSCGGGGSGGGGGGSGTVNLSPVAKGTPSTKAEASLSSRGLFAGTFDFFFGGPVNAQSPSSLTIGFKDGCGTITSALVIFREVDFREEGVPEEEEDEFEFEGPFLIEIIGNTAIPDEITGIPVPAGNFNEVRFRIDDKPPVGGIPSSASGIINRSMLIKGSVIPGGSISDGVCSGGDPTNFTFKTDLDERIKAPFNLATPLTVDSGDLINLLVVFDFEGIFNSVPGGATTIAAAAALTSPVGLLDEDANVPNVAKEVADVIEDAIDDNIDVFNDLNDDDIPDLDKDIGDDDCSDDGVCIEIED